MIDVGDYVLSTANPRLFGEIVSLCPDRGTCRMVKWTTGKRVTASASDLTQMPEEDIDRYSVAGWKFAPAGPQQIAKRSIEVRVTWDFGHGQETVG